MPIRERHESVKTRGCTRRNAVEAHRKRASGEVVGTQHPSELREEPADRPVLVRSFPKSENGVNSRSRVRTIAQVYRGQSEVVGWPVPHVHGMIKSLQQNDERIFGLILFFFGHHPPRR